MGAGLTGRPSKEYHDPANKVLRALRPGTGHAAAAGRSARRHLLGLPRRTRRHAGPRRALARRAPLARNGALLAGTTGTAWAFAARSGRFVPRPFHGLIDEQSGRTRVRLVDIASTRYAIARRYMIAGFAFFLVWELTDGEKRQLADLDREGVEFVAARGGAMGRGGRGARGGTTTRRGP